MSSVVRTAAVVVLAALAGCAAHKPPTAEPPQATPPPTPALATFVAVARKMGATYEPPAGYSEIPVRANSDQAYHYAIASADRRIELRFTLLPCDLMPPEARDRQMAFAFFMTGISNLVRSGETGTFGDSKPIPADYFSADQATLILLRWFQAKKGPNAFGDGYETSAATFLYRERVGAAYIFALFKDRDAVAGFGDGTLHALHFAPR